MDAPELLCPELPVVAELLRLPVPELSLVPELLLELVPLVEPELFSLSLWPDGFWSSEPWPEGDALVGLLDPVVCPVLLPPEALLCAIASALAATNTHKIPGNSLITVSIVRSASEYHRLRYHCAVDQ